MRQRPWIRGALAGVALASLVGTSVLAFAEDLPTSLRVAPSDGATRISKAGMDLIEQFESRKLTGYVLGDGMCTIGVGHAVPLSEMPADKCKQWTITDAQADEFLREDANEFEGCLNDYFDRSFNQNQFDALVSFTYNVGCAPRKYEWPKDAADSYFPGVMIQYTNPPQFKEGLTKRRKAEIALFENPQLPAAEVVAQPATQSTPTFEVPVITEPEATAPQVTVPEVPAPQAVEPAPVVVDIPTVVVTQFPEIAPLFSGGISAR